LPGFILTISRPGDSNGASCHALGRALGLCTRLLGSGGVATDDYCDHCWTRQEIETGAIVGGLRFFDFQAFRRSTHEGVEQGLGQ